MIVTFTEAKYDEKHERILLETGKGVVILQPYEPKQWRELCFPLKQAIDAADDFEREVADMEGELSHD